jgi:hypothetical protein
MLQCQIYLILNQFSHKTTYAISLEIYLLMLPNFSCIRAYHYEKYNYKDTTMHIRFI